MPPHLRSNGSEQQLDRKFYLFLFERVEYAMVVGPWPCTVLPNEIYNIYCYLTYY